MCSLGSSPPNKARHGQWNESFSDLRNLLTRNAPRDDVRASAMLRVLNEAPEIEGVLADPPGDKSLRSKVAQLNPSVAIRGARSRFIRLTTSWKRASVLRQFRPPTTVEVLEPRPDANRS